MRAGPDQGRRRVPAALQHRVNPQSGMVLGQTGDGFSQNRAGIRGHSVSSGACWPAAGFFLTVADMDHHQVLAKAERFRGGPFHSDGRVRGPVGADDNTGPVFVAGRGHDRHHAVADGGRLKTDRPEALTVPVRAPVGSYHDHVRIPREPPKGPGCLSCPESRADRDRGVQRRHPLGFRSQQLSGPVHGLLIPVGVPEGPRTRNDTHQIQGYMKLGGPPGRPLQCGVTGLGIIDTNHDPAVHDSMPFGELASTSNIPALSSRSLGPEGPPARVPGIANSRDDGFQKQVPLR